MFTVDLKQPFMVLVLLLVSPRKGSKRAFTYQKLRQEVRLRPWAPHRLRRCSHTSRQTKTAGLWHRPDGFPFR